MSSFENLKSNLSKYHYSDWLIKQQFWKVLSVPQIDLRKPEQPSNENIFPFITNYNPNIYSTSKSSVNCLNNNNVSGFLSINLIQSKRRPSNLKKKLTKVEYRDVLSGTSNCTDKRCECCNYLLINDLCTIKKVKTTFKLRNCFTCDSFNIILVVICDTRKHVKKNILEIQGKKILNWDTESEYIINTFSNHNTAN